MRGSAQSDRGVQGPAVTEHETLRLPQLKGGQTVQIAGQWATVTYLVGECEVIVALDDGRQLQVDRTTLKLPPRTDPQRPGKRKTGERRCTDCNAPVSPSSTRCRDCVAAHLSALGGTARMPRRGRDIVVNPLTHPHLSRQSAGEPDLSGPTREA